MKQTTYKGHIINHNLSGWYSCYIPGQGFVKADTIPGIKKLIREAINNS